MEAEEKTVSPLLHWGNVLKLFQLLAIRLAFALFKLIWMIVHPTILEFPWPFNHYVNDTGKVVVLAGSYNPPHKGHVEMLRYLSSRYGQVIVAIGVNPEKVYDVTPYQRAHLLDNILKNELKSCSNIRVQVIHGYIWRAVYQQGACIFFRGIRSWSKDRKEERHLQIVNTWGPLVLGPLWWPIPTWFLTGDPQYNHISSTLIRNILLISDPIQGNVKMLEKRIETLVPLSIATDVVQLYGRVKVQKH